MTRAVLLDLYDTVGYGDWSTSNKLLSSELGIDDGVLIAALDQTHVGRSIGAYGDMEQETALVLALCGIEADDALLARAVELRQRLLIASFNLYPDTRPFIDWARAHGIKTAVVSNCSHSTRALFDWLELPVDQIVLSCELGIAKPDPGIFVEALRLLNEQPGDTVFVDDQDRYAAGAAVLGIRAIQIERDMAQDKDTVTGNYPLVTGFDALKTLV